MRTEASILEAMDRLVAGRTSFMVAHRPSALAVCDVRLELTHGRLLEATSNGARAE
jgi:ABC-type multidrug transport system fused ATPase/permease subunit